MPTDPIVSGCNNMLPVSDGDSHRYPSGFQSSISAHKDFSTSIPKTRQTSYHRDQDKISQESYSSPATKTSTTLPPREDDSLFVGTKANLPMAHFSQLLGTVAAGVCGMVAWTLYRYFVRVNQAMTARIDLLTETQRISLHLLQQSIQSMQSTSNQHGQVGEDVRGTSTSSKVFPREFHLLHTEGPTSGLSVMTALALAACALFVIAAIERRFNRPLLGATKREPSLRRDAPSSNNRSTTSTHFSPSETRMEPSDPLYAPERKRPRARSVSFECPSDSPESAATRIPPRQWISQHPPAPLDHPPLETFVSTQSERTPVPPPQRPAPTAAMTHPVARSPARPAVVSTSRTADILAPATSAAPRRSSEKASKKEAQSAIRARLATEDQQLKTRKSSPSVPTSLVRPLHEIFMSQQTEQTPMTPQKRPEQMTAMTRPVNSSSTKPVVIHMSPSAVWMVPGTSAIPSRFDEQVTKREARNAIRARLAMEDKQQKARKSNPSTPMKGAAVETHIKRVAVTKVSDTIPAKKSPAAERTPFPRKKEDLQVIRARVREQFSPTPGSTPIPQKKKKVQSSLKQAPAGMHGSPQQMSLSRSPSKKNCSNQAMSAKQLRLIEVRAQVRENQHLLGR
jgi:hypothetical protein